MNPDYFCPICKREVHAGHYHTATENTSSLSKEVRQQNHYTQFPIQPIEFIIKNNLNYLQGNIIKYVCRYKSKNGIEDLEKAKHYLDMLISNEKGDFKI